MKLMRFTIKSLSPGMLQNPATEQLLKDLRDGTRPQKRTDWTVEEEAGTKLYRSENGRMGVPMQNIMSAIIAAGTLVKSGGKPISTAKTTKVFDFLEFVEDFCVFKDCDEKGNVQWKPFQSKGNLKQKGSETAVCITRPRIPQWSLQFTVWYDEKRGFSQDTMVKLVEVACRIMGLGDWRPSRKGRFGRSVIEKVEVLPIERKEEVIEVVEYTEKNAPVELLELAGV